jgi:hypothetical protein
VTVSALQQVVRTIDGVRDTSAVHARYTGSLIAFSADSLLLDVGAAQHSFARSSVLRLEASRGMRPATGRAALTGAVAGGLLLGVVSAVGIAAEDNSCESWSLDIISPGEAFVAGLGLGALTGGLLGALIESQSRTERWVEVPIGEGTTVTPSIGPAGGGLTLRIGPARR